MSAAQGDPFANLGGTFADIHKINEKLREAKQRAFLLTPGTTGLQLPTSGCYVAFNVLHVDPATEAHSVGGGKLSLLRTALVQLADMAGIVWDNERSGQVADTVRHPHYVRWHEECARRDLDGTVLRNKGDVCIDLRDGSDMAEQVLQDAKEGRGPRNLLDRRAKILEHAQSKAQNRAIRAALKIRSYTADELLKKPFVVARLVWTTKDDDPQIERENKRDVRRLFTGGARALFGDSPATSAPALPPAIEYARLPAATAPVATTTDGEIVGDEPDLDDPALSRQPSQPDIGTQVAPQAPAPTPQAATPAPARRPAPAPASGERSGVTIPGGRSKGQAIEDAEEKDIVYWRDKIRDELADGSCEPRFRGSSEKRLAAMNAELVRRGSPGAPRPPSGRTPEQDVFGNDEPPF